MNRTYGLLSCGVLALVLAAGCGAKTNTDTVYKATGVLTVGGKPLKNVRVTFYPVGEGTPSSGMTDDKGEFNLVTQKGAEGAVAGKHKVVLSVEAQEAQYGKSSARGGDPTKTKLPFPVKYTQRRSTPKEVEVTADGENHFEIKL